MKLDALDRHAADAFTGLVVRKDLVRQFRGQFPIPTYVVEFMLGRYCATTDEKEITEGLELVRSQLSSRTVRAGEEVRRYRLFGRVPGRNKLKAGSRLLVSPFPEIKFICLVAGCCEACGQPPSCGQGGGNA